MFSNKKNNNEVNNNQNTINVEKDSKQIGTKASGMAFILCFVFSVIFGFVGGLVIGSSESFIVQMVAYTLMQLTFLCVIVVVCLYNKTNFLKEFNLKKNAHYSSYLIFSVLAVILIFSFVWFLNIFEFGLFKLNFTSSAIDLTAKTPLELIVSLVAVAVVPAILEELVFRGIIFKGCLQYGKIQAVIISALAFSLFHGSIEQTIFQFVLGVVCALIYLKTGDIKLNITFHFVNNAVILIYSYFVTSANVALTSVKLWEVFVSLALVAVGIIFIWLSFFVVKKIKKEQTPLAFVKEEKNYNVLFIIASFICLLNWVVNTLNGFGIKFF